MRSMIVMALLAMPGLALAQPLDDQKKAQEIETQKAEVRKAVVAARRTQLQRAEEAARAQVQRAEEAANTATSEKKIADLEAKLQALLKEIQDLRGGKRAVVVRVRDEAKPAEKAEIKKGVTFRLSTDGKPLAILPWEGELRLTDEAKADIKKGVTLRLSSDGKQLPVGDLKGELLLSGSPDGKRIEKAVGGHIIVIDAATGKVIEQRGDNVKDGKDGKTTEKRVIVVEHGAPHASTQGNQNPMQALAAWAQADGAQRFTFSGGDPNTVHLTRVTYTLADAKQAKALDDFLKAFAKAKVLETKVEEDKLVVTTTPEVQGTVGQVVGLMTGKPAGGVNHFQMQFSTPHLNIPIQNKTWSVEPVKPIQPKSADPTKPLPKPTEPTKKQPKSAEPTKAKSAEPTKAKSAEPIKP